MWISHGNDLKMIFTVWPDLKTEHDQYVRGSQSIIYWASSESIVPSVYAIDKKLFSIDKMTLHHLKVEKINL